MWSRLAVLGAFVFLLTDGASVLAADPPGRVGRVSFIEGTVSLRPAEQEASPNTQQDNQQGSQQDADWRAATVNFPITTGNSLWTESGAKAEVQVGPAEVRLDQQTELEVMRLDDNAVELTLHQGNVNVHVSDQLPGGLRIDTPRGPVSLMRPGSYRIGVDTSGASDNVEIAAFDGEAQFAAETEKGSDTHTVRGGESLKLAGIPGEVVLGDAAVSPFDQWAKSRDPGTVIPQQAQAPTPSGTVQPLARPAQQAVQQTTQYVSPQATGYQDLAAYGTWEQAPNYGAVWYPTAVVADWAPYRYGHWEYIRPWGWTWIDDAPWGFTPFHYGRWVRVGPRWAWWPGRRAVRPVYAPALVAFVGSSGWSVSITSGHARPVGWVPLAPYEVYRPYYRTSATYVRNVNVTTVNKTVINNITVNKNVEVNKYVNRNSTTVVSAENFARGRKVNESKINVPRKEIDRARVTNEVRRIQPQKVADRAEAPHPRHDEARRAANPAVMQRDQQQRQQREAQDKQRRNQAELQKRQQVDRQKVDRQQRDAGDRQQHEAQGRQPREQTQQQRQQADQQHRAQQDQQKREQAAQQRRQRDAQDQQRREQPRQQREQQQREQSQRQQRDQQSQLDQQQRQKRAQQEQQQRQVQEQRRRQQDAEQRAQQDAKQRAQQQAQQRQVQEQRRQQAEPQQRRQQEQAREVERRRGPDRQDNKRDRDG